MGVKICHGRLSLPPPSYTRQPNRFFSYRILPSIFVEASDEDGEHDAQEEDQRKKKRIKTRS